jgi:diacylglycerol kinase family enzyme
VTADTCVIFNPAAGRGRAAARLCRLRSDLKGRAEFRPTRRPGEAEHLALEAAKEGFPTLGAAGGDGTVHEVANGLLRSGVGAALAVFPVGSANDYAYGLGLEPAWWCRRDGAAAVRPVDVGLAEGPDGRRRYFINGMGLGLNCAVTVEARKLPWLQGVPLYLLALLRAVWSRYTSPALTVSFDGTVRHTPTLALTLAVGRREGSFLVAPDARLDDSLFDYLHVGPLPRRRLFRYLPGLVTGHIPHDDPLIWTGRCRAAALQSEVPLMVHCDGEFLCLPEDNVLTLEVHLLPGALRVRTRYP